MLTCQLIASQFGISERLQKMMCTEPLKQPVHVDDRNVDIDRPIKSPEEDPENGFRLVSHHASTDTGTSMNLTFSQVVNDIWHFCSVDYGPRCTNCLEILIFYVANQFTSFLYWI